MKTRRTRDRCRGSVLAAMAAVAAIVFVIGAGLIQLGFHSRLQAVRIASAISARCAADAGIAIARYKMNKKLAAEVIWDNTTLPSAPDAALPGSDGSVAYTVTGDPAGFLVTATGKASRATKQIYISLGTASAWEGIGVKETVDIKLGTTFGHVPEDYPGPNLTIRTNSTDANALGFKSFVTIPGNVLCGPGGDPDVVIDTKSTTVIEGETRAALQPIEFPPVLLPTDTWIYSGSLTAASTIIDTPGAYQYDAINLPNSGILRIQAPATIYVVGTTVLNNTSEIIIEGDGALSLYLGGNLEDKNSTGFTNGTFDAMRLKIYGLDTCLHIDLKAKSDFYGAIYAPEAHVDLYNGGDFYGSIAARSFDMKNSGSFYYDRRLSDVDINDAAAVFKVLRWWEE